jgi:hypothetical protein
MTRLEYYRSCRNPKQMCRNPRRQISSIKIINNKVLASKRRSQPTQVTKSTINRGFLSSFRNTLTLTSSHKIKWCVSLEECSYNDYNWVLVLVSSFGTFCLVRYLWRKVCYLLVIYWVWYCFHNYSICQGYDSQGWLRAYGSVTIL